MNCWLVVLLVGIFVIAGCAGAPVSAQEKACPPGFSVTGDWSYSSLAGCAPGKCTLFTDKVGATATWNPQITSVAPVRISFHVVGYKGGNDPKVKIEIVHNGKTDEKYLDATGTESRWAELGTFDFAGKGDEFVRLTKVTEHTHARVSALKLEIMDAQKPGFVWQTLVMDNPTPYTLSLLKAEPTEAERIASVKGGPPDPAKWELTFSDDFNGDKLNPDVWESAKADTRQTLLSIRVPESIIVKDGILQLMTRKEKRGEKDWTSAYIWTKSFKQKYGYWESRFRYAGASGLNNAFWMHPGRTKKGEGFEIDVNEGHYPNAVEMTLHQEEMPANSKHWCAGLDLSKDFHVYAAEWNEKDVIFYLDGRELHRAPNTKAHLECPVIFSTAVITWAGPVSDALDGKSMDVDWVKVYRMKDER